MTDSLYRVPYSFTTVPLTATAMQGNSKFYTNALQMFTGNYGGSAGKSECGDFKFMGIACIPAIPVILKSPHSDFHCNICREFDFIGILRGFPALDVGKQCNNLIFVDIHAKFAGISCKF